MGTHLRVLSKSYPMNTNMTGFRCFSKIFAFFFGALALKGLKYHYILHFGGNSRGNMIVMNTITHGLSQQGVWVPFWTPKPLKSTPQDTQFFSVEFSKNLKLKLIIEFFHLLIIPMTLFNDIMPYFAEFINVYD